MNRLFKNGTIVIKRDTHNIMEKNTYIEAVKDVDEVFEKIKKYIINKVGVIDAR